MSVVSPDDQATTAAFIAYVQRTFHQGEQFTIELHELGGFAVYPGEMVLVLRREHEQLQREHQRLQRQLRELSDELEAMAERLSHEVTRVRGLRLQTNK